MSLLRSNWMSWDEFSNSVYTIIAVYDGILNTFAANNDSGPEAFALLIDRRICS